MNLKLTTILFNIFCFLSISLKSQINIGSNDSLKGFDEQSFLIHQSSHGLSGLQLKQELEIAKKEFIFEKYHKGNNFDAFLKTASATTVVQPACTNMDFETGTFFGWVGSTGTNSNSVSMGGCCPTVGAVNSAVINSTGFDPTVGGTLLPLSSPFGGSKIARVNNVATGSKVDRIAQSFNVTSSNAIFQIAFAAVLNSIGSHSCTQQPFVNISLIDSAGNTLACPFLSFSAPSSLCATGGPSWIAFSGGHYKNWSIQTLDLSPYIGSFVTIQFTVGDCTQSGHYGYAYFDCKCLPLEISLNSTIFDATPSTPINVSTCGSISALINAPTGLGPYSWNGPVASGISGTTTQSISTSTPGTYTLTMSPDGACYGPTVKYIILNVSPNPTVTNITSQATCTNSTGSSTILVVGGSSPYSYNWLPSASTSSLGTGLSPGTNYTVTVVDLYGCQNNTAVSILSFANAPTYTVTPLTANLTCLTNTISVSALTGLNTTAVWSNTATPSFITGSAGTYSVLLTNTISLCHATVPVIITSNTIIPSATYSVSCNSGTISLNASSSAGIALGWLAPTLPTPSPISNPGFSTASGIFTLTATNLSTGCKRTYTVQSAVSNLSISITPQNTITCLVKVIKLQSSSTLPGAVFTWQYGITTHSVNPYYILTGGTYTATASYPGGCSTKSIITIASDISADVAISTPSIIPCLTNSLTLNASSLSGGPYTYTWSSPNGTGNNYTVTNPGTYTVFATNSANGCTTTATKAVSHETVNASFVANPYQGIAPLSVSFTNTSINPPATNYYWDFGNSTNSIATYTTSTTYFSGGTFTVILTATNGLCVDTAMKYIKVDFVSSIIVPNVFTPNGDGRNDLFIIDFSNIEEISVSIFDRWGLVMFEENDKNKINWDGKTKNGTLATDGVYFYVIRATGLDNQKHSLKGTLNLFGK